MKDKRPHCVTAMAVMFLYIGSIGIIFLPIMAGADLILPFLRLFLGKLIHVGPLLTFSSYALLIIWYLTYVLIAFIGFGLWRLKNWARQAVVAICAISIVIGLLLLIWVRPLELALAILTLDALQMGLTWWYLSWPQVRRSFGLPVEILPSTNQRLRVGLVGGGSVVVGLVVFGGSVMMFGENIFHHSAPYRVAMAAAVASPCVRLTIGTPLVSGWLITGDENEQGDYGSANLSIPVKGPNGEGKLLVDAKKTAGRWNVSVMNLGHDKHLYTLVPSPGSNGCVLAR